MKTVKACFLEKEQGEVAFKTHYQKRFFQLTAAHHAHIIHRNNNKTSTQPEVTMPNPTPDTVNSLDMRESSALRIVYADEALNPSPTLDTTKDIASLAVTSKSLHSFFQPLVRERMLKQLMLFVLHGEPENARKIYEKNPELLFMRVSATDLASGLSNFYFEPVYRIINSTPLRAMVGGGDVWMLDEVWKALPDYRERIIEQIHQQFPNGFEHPEAIFDYTALVQAIYTDQQLVDIGVPNQNTVAELEIFRAHFLPDQDSTKETIGHHFNMNEYERARRVYQAHWVRWTNNQCSLFFRQVIGCLQGLFSVANGQALLQTPEKVDMPGGKHVLSRNLRFKNYTRSITYGADEVLFRRTPYSSSSSILGRDYAIYSGRGGIWLPFGSDKNHLQQFTPLIASKIDMLSELVLYKRPMKSFGCCVIL